jgi:hypothetical protein
MFTVHPVLKVVFCKICFIASSEYLLEYFVEEENWISKFLADARLL